MYIGDGVRMLALKCRSTDKRFIGRPCKQYEKSVMAITQYIEWKGRRRGRRGRRRRKRRRRRQQQKDGQEMLVSRELIIRA